MKNTNKDLVSDKCDNKNHDSVDDSLSSTKSEETTNVNAKYLSSRTVKHNLKCPLCSHRGRQKYYCNSWRFTYHLRTKHPENEEAEALIDLINFLIIKEVLV